MARGRYRQRRRRRRLILLGMVAAAGAFTLWFRSTTGHYPWATADGPEDTRLSLTGIRGSTVQPELATIDKAVQASSPDEPAGENDSTGSPATPPPPLARELSASAGADIPTTFPALDRPAEPDSARAGGDFKAGLEALERGDLVAARRLLGQAYLAGLSANDERQAREKLAGIAAQTLFSSRNFQDDPLCEFITVRSGDTLGAIAGRHSLSEDFVAAVNNIKNKNFIREGQRLKVARGPWHAVVSKSRHTMDVYLQDKYVRSFRVALGVGGSTPTGAWKVINRQLDPGWTDPRTGQRWHPSDPQNPIGEHWIGLEGVSGEAVGQFGYGIHGTIEPETIGQDVSMGCVRLAPDDVALVYQLLLPGRSYVKIAD